MEPEPSSEVALFQEEEEVWKELTFFAKRQTSSKEKEDDIEVYMD